MSPPSVHKVCSDGFCTKLRTVEVRREAATRCRRPIVVVVVVVDADGGRERSHWQIFVVDAIANGDDVFSSPSQTAVGRSRRVWVCSRTESTKFVTRARICQKRTCFVVGPSLAKGAFGLRSGLWRVYSLLSDLRSYGCLGVCKREPHSLVLYCTRVNNVNTLTLRLLSAESRSEVYNSFKLFN